MRRGDGDEGDGANVSFPVDTDAVCLRNEPISPSPAIPSRTSPSDVTRRARPARRSRPYCVLYARKNSVTPAWACRCISVARASLARQALGRPTARSAKPPRRALENTARRPEHPATKLIGRIGDRGRYVRAQPARRLRRKALRGWCADRRRCVELRHRPYFLHEHACTRTCAHARHRSSMLESQFHAGQLLSSVCWVATRRPCTSKQRLSEVVYCMFFCITGIRVKRVVRGCVPQTLRTW